MYRVTCLMVMNSYEFLTHKFRFFNNKDLYPEKDYIVIYTHEVIISELTEPLRQCNLKP